MAERIRKTVNIEFEISKTTSPVYSNVTVVNPLVEAAVVHFGYVDPSHVSFEIETSTSETPTLKPVSNLSVVLDKNAMINLISQLNEALNDMGGTQ